MKIAPIVVLLFLAVITCIAALTPIIVLAAIVNGLVLSVLWGWFVVPVFGLPHLSIVSAIGITLVINYIAYRDLPDRDKKKEQDKDTMIKDLVLVIMRPGVALFCGWILHMFM